MKKTGIIVFLALAGLLILFPTLGHLLPCAPAADQLLTAVAAKSVRVGVLRAAMGTVHLPLPLFRDSDCLIF